MKKHFYLLLLISNIGLSQISIDNFTVYNTGTTLDSFQITVTSNGQNFVDIQWVTFNDLCNQISYRMAFVGCETGQPNTIDTTFVFGGYSTKVSVGIIWDTISTCPEPFQVTVMDRATWNMCNNVGIEEKLLQSRISVYPNPSKGAVHLQNSTEIEITDIWLLDQTGKRIKQFGKHEETFDLSEFEKGIYLLKIGTNSGEVIKKIFYR